MDISDIDTLPNMIDMSSTDSEDNEDHQIKKSKIFPKVKLKTQKGSKKVQKYRPRKVADRLPKNTPKRYAKSYGAYRNRSSSNEFMEEEYDQKFLPDTTTTSHLLPVVDILEKYNFKYEVKPDTNKKLDDFFLQDKYMNAFFKYYPDYICVDLLCEIIELELNLYLFISVDSNGHCEIISIGLFKSCESGLMWLCEVFKKHNLNWRKIKLVMTDKKARNNEILKNSFPEKPILLSFFHSMKAMKKDLANLDYKITDEDVNKVLQIFEQMIFSTAESSYSELLKQMKSMPPVISTYFRKSWHQKKEFWALGQQLNSKTFLKSFNAYLSLIRKTIRPLISTLNSIESVIKTLCTVIEKMRMERFQKFTSVFPKLNANVKQTVSIKYFKLLTNYAAELVCEQISLSADVKNMKKLATGKFICSSEDIVTTNTCSCTFFQLLSLPCSHIFNVRRLLSLPFYCELICAFRWIATNYQDTYVDMQNVYSTENRELNPESNAVRFQKYFKISADLWPLLVQCPESVAQDRIIMLRNLLRAWEHGISVNIKTSEIQSESLPNTIVPEDSSSDDWKEMYGISLKDILDSDNDISVLPITI